MDFDDTMGFIGTVPLEGNVIDFAILQEQGTVVYSMDTIHEPFSTTAVASDLKQQTRPSIGATSSGSMFAPPEKNVGSHGKLIASMEQCVKDQPFVMQEAPGKGRSMRELLYGLESLRKRGGEDNNGGDD